MWILPKQLHTSDFVQATEGLNLDLSESSQLCAQSLFARSKPLPARTWLQKWKRDSWTAHLFGRILKPSLGEHFATAWTSCLEATHANHSQAQESDSAKTTQDTYGPGSKMVFDLCDQESASLKTSKGTSALDSERLSKNWKDLVTKRRGEFLARLKLERLTNVNACSSWPTCTAREWKGTSPNYAFRKDGKSRADILAVAVDLEERNACPTPTVQEAGKIGNQANNGQLGLSNHPAIRGQCKREKFAKGKHGLPAPANPSTDGSRQESWATPAGKLNPRWVETLMGLPVGWVMPSCKSPVTIEQTNCDCLETESCQQPLSAPSGC